MPFLQERNLSNAGRGFPEPGNKSLLLAQHSLHNSERTRSHHRRDATSLPLPLMGSALDQESLPSKALNSAGMPSFFWISWLKKKKIFTWISFSVHNLFCWIILSNKNKWKRGILHCLCVHQLAVEQKRQVMNISLLNTANKNKHLKPQMKRLHPHTCHKINP